MADDVFVVWDGTRGAACGTRYLSATEERPADRVYRSLRDLSETERDGILAAARFETWPVVAKRYGVRISTVEHLVDLSRGGLLNRES